MFIVKCFILELFVVAVIGIGKIIFTEKHPLKVLYGMFSFDENEES